MKTFRLEYGSFRLDYDADYGCDHRSGWSVCIDGIVEVQLEKWLLVALVKAFWR